MIEIINSPTLKSWDGKQMVPAGGQVILTLDAETLAEADLSGQRLHWAYLPLADLKRVNFSHTSLHGANLSGADLRGANFAKASMMMANLMGANLAGAFLSGAILPGARLQGADLRFAVLQDAMLRYARYDETTLWPEGFDPQQVGAKMPSQIREWAV